MRSPCSFNLSRKTFSHFEFHAIKIVKLFSYVSIQSLWGMAARGDSSQLGDRFGCARIMALELAGAGVCSFPLSGLPGMVLLVIFGTLESSVPFYLNGIVLLSVALPVLLLLGKNRFPAGRKELACGKINILFVFVHSLYCMRTL